MLTNATALKVTTTTTTPMDPSIFSEGAWTLQNYVTVSPITVPEVRYDWIPYTEQQQQLRIVQSPSIPRPRHPSGLQEKTPAPPPQAIHPSSGDPEDSLTASHELTLRQAQERRQEHFVSLPSPQQKLRQSLSHSMLPILPSPEPPTGSWRGQSAGTGAAPVGDRHPKHQDRRNWHW